MIELTYIAELRHQEKLLTDYLKSPEGMQLEVALIVKLGKEILRLRAEIRLYEHLRETKDIHKIWTFLK